jgi:hypothetical protein
MKGRNVPSPIPSTNSSYYDPAAQFTPADGDGGTSSALSGAASNAVAAPPEVSIPPVVITGDVGVRQLLQNYDAALERPDCSLEGATAALSCGKAGLVAAGGILLSSTTVVGTGLAVAMTLAEGVECGKDLRAYYDCKVQ